jgi:hypothetical protein
VQQVVVRWTERVEMDYACLFMRLAGHYAAAVVPPAYLRNYLRLFVTITRWVKSRYAFLQTYKQALACHCIDDDFLSKLIFAF